MQWIKVWVQEITLLKKKRWYLPKEQDLTSFTVLGIGNVAVKKKNIPAIM